MMGHTLMMVKMDSLGNQAMVYFLYHVKIKAIRITQLTKFQLWPLSMHLLLDLQLIAQL